MSDPYLGEIRMLAFPFAPSGWALCQGQTMPVTQNQALFALLGTLYGGNGSTNFQLPNLAGRSPVGTGTGQNLSPIDQADIGGNETIQLTNAQLPSHTHTATSAGGGGTVTVPVTVTGQVAIPATTNATGCVAAPATSTVLGPVGEGGRAGTLYNAVAANTTLAPFPVSLSGTGTGTVTAPTVTIGATGQGGPAEIRNPYLGMIFAIALEGIFPTRS